MAQVTGIQQEPNVSYFLNNTAGDWSQGDGGIDKHYTDVTGGVREIPVRDVDSRLFTLGGSAYNEFGFDDTVVPSDVQELLRIQVNEEVWGFPITQSPVQHISVYREGTLLTGGTGRLYWTGATFVASGAFLVPLNVIMSKTFTLNISGQGETVQNWRDWRVAIQARPAGGGEGVGSNFQED